MIAAAAEEGDPCPVCAARMDPLPHRMTGTRLMCQQCWCLLPRENRVAWVSRLGFLGKLRSRAPYLHAVADLIKAVAALRARA